MEFHRSTLRIVAMLVGESWLSKLMDPALLKKTETVVAVNSR